MAGSLAFDLGPVAFTREEEDMSVHQGKYADQRARSNERDSRPAATGNNGHLHAKVARRPGFVPPSNDQDSLTAVLLTIVMVLTALNVMLRFPDLGALIAQYNQF